MSEPKHQTDKNGGGALLSALSQKTANLLLIPLQNDIKQAITAASSKKLLSKSRIRNESNRCQNARKKD